MEASLLSERSGKQERQKTDSHQHPRQRDNQPQFPIAFFEQGKLSADVCQHTVPLWLLHSFCLRQKWPQCNAFLSDCTHNQSYVGPPTSLGKATRSFGPKESTWVPPSPDYS